MATIRATVSAKSTIDTDTNSIVHVLIAPVDDISILAGSIISIIDIDIVMVIPYIARYIHRSPVYNFMAFYC